MARGTDDPVRRLIPLFERVGTLYIGGMLRPHWERVRPTTAPRSLEFFLGSYAFQRFGARPSYAPAASAALQRSSPDLDANEVWKAFRNLVTGGTNAKVNPLNHQRSATCACAICVLRRDVGTLDVVRWSRTLLEADDVSKAHRQLRAIRGIGPKIASFFLRDIAIWYDIAPSDNRDLLQPIDLWIRRFAKMLDPSATQNDRSIRRWMVETFSFPEHGNAGMWYFGKRIAPRRPSYERALQEPTYAHKIVDQARTGGAAETHGVLALASLARARGLSPEWHSRQQGRPR